MLFLNVQTHSVMILHVFICKENGDFCREGSGNTVTVAVSLLSAQVPRPVTSSLGFHLFIKSKCHLSKLIKRGTSLLL
jgi:hypothetical protein